MLRAVGIEAELSRGRNHSAVGRTRAEGTVAVHDQPAHAVLEVSHVLHVVERGVVELSIVAGRREGFENSSDYVVRVISSKNNILIEENKKARLCVGEVG